MDWSLMQDLVQQASSAALGRDDSVAGNEEAMVELMGCLSELREFAAQGANGVVPGVTVVQNKGAVIQLVVGAGELKQETASGKTAPTVSPEQAELLFLRAVTATSVHRRTALTQQQNTPDPGQKWLVEQGELKESAVDWMGLAYPKLPDRCKIGKLEEVFRSIEHMGKPVEHMDHTAVDSHMSEVPEALKNSLRNTMQYGVKTGISRPEETNEAKATSTAAEYADEVSKEMRKAAVHGWTRVFPPSMRY